MQLKDKVAIITGAGAGIGKAIAKRFALEGAKVVLCDINAESLTQVTAELKLAGYDYLAFEVDVRDKETIEYIINQVIETYDTIDVLVNNAGVTRDAMIHKMDEEDWDAVIDINLKGYFNFTKPIAKIMRANSKGRIINISSASRFGNVGQSNYSASKAAVVGFTRAVAKELGPKGVNVNAIAPGTVITDMYYQIPEHIRDLMNLITPLGRPGNVDEVANLCLFLSTEESSYITGQVIQCDGGMFMV
ncbi:MAG TPA: 3-oxoacyl-ACP reductase FabG [Syntrophomonadaceae bacterium]|nr:3-oxoacyl-ACP reductase FabG [Syntrophomonadaceae bacterium]